MKTVKAQTRSASEGSSRFFDPAALAGLERMRFTTPRRVDGNYSGRHAANSRGGAGEFVDYREYTAGDDLRRLDWKAMARMGRMYLKLFQDETDLSCTMLLDCSGSMAQGAKSEGDLRGSKFEWMQYFSTALSHLIVLGRDAVGLAAVRASLAEYLPPMSSMQHRRLVHAQIEALRPDGTTDLAQGLDDLLIRARRRGVLLIVSDFLIDPLDSIVASIRKFRSRGWEVVALHLIDPDEQNLPDGMAFRFLDQEGEGVVNCQLTEVRKEYQRRFEAQAAAIRGALLSVGCDYQRILTSASYTEALRSFLVVRSA